MSFSDRALWPRVFLASDAIRRWFDSVFPMVAAGLGRGAFSTLDRQALEASEQLGVQSVTALCGNRLKGKKWKHAGSFG